jgi:hypothetical protein
VQAAALAAALGAAAPAAHASPTQESLFMDDNLLLYRGDDVADSTLKELKGLGVDRVRISVHWRAIAPAETSPTRPDTFKDATDPAQYDPTVFDKYDHLLRVARQLGIAVLFDVTGDAPLWATGRLNGKPVDQAYKPSSKAFGEFVQMLGARYDGKHTDENQGGGSVPRVDAWSIWNEPNEGAQLQPQWERSKKTRRWVMTSPRLYRNLARSAIAALGRTGHGGDQVLLGETAPRGVNPKGRTRAIRPIRFLAAFFCLDEKTLKPLRRSAATAKALGCDWGRPGKGALAVSGYAHHPYSITSPPATPDANTLDVTLADAPRLAAMLDAAAAAHRVPAGLPYWWTEYGWQTPPDPIRGVDPANQALWLGQAEQISRADGRAAALAQFQLRDDPPREGATDRDRWITYQSGLEYADGSHKPAYDAYRLPLVATDTVAAGQPLTLWGLVRPAEGATPVTLQFAAEGTSDFQDVANVNADGPAGSFTTTVTPERSGTYRFRWTPPGATSPPQSLGDALLGKKPAPPPSYNSLAVTVHVR